MQSEVIIFLSSSITTFFLNEQIFTKKKKKIKYIYIYIYASDEDHQQSMAIDERKQRRMISNRESARRSRMRKQRHLDELWSQVIRLRTDNHCLIDKLNNVSESHELALKENAKLKEETSDLRQLLSEIKSNNEDDNNFLRDLEDSISNTRSGSDQRGRDFELY
ncbi:BnaC08g40240D [Brassica napus]|uniref:BnaC08g40240D protein n=1 Tax=Brassica napus TaxID=3708 RepID=A0A078FT60_BRANA|nr:BnaC08g40240D [Brassica napus]